MKYLIVGTGSIGSRHAKNIAEQDPSAELILVLYDREANPYIDDLKKTLSDHKDVYTLKEGLLLKPDAALICNPTAYHVTTALDILPTCKNILIEKPLSHNRNNVLELSRLAAKHKANILIAYCLRWHPVIMRVRELLDKKTLGKIFTARLVSSSYLPTWRKQDYKKIYSAQQALGGGVILDVSHEIDYAYWLFGKVNTVKATGGKLSTLEIDSEDTAEIVLCHATGIISSVHLDCTSVIPARTCTIIGEKGVIRADLLANKIEIILNEDNENKKKSTKKETVKETVTEVLTEEPASMYIKEINHFIATCKGKETSKIPLEDGIAVLNICLAAKAQLPIQKPKVK